MDVVQYVARVVIGIIFILSSVPKLRHPRGFALTVRTYDLLSRRLALAYAHAVPALEMGSGVFLVSGALPRVAAVTTALLCATFGIGIAVNLSRGRRFDCGCFGSRGRRIGPSILVEDLVLLTGAVALAMTLPGWLASSAWSPARAMAFSPASAALAAAGVTAAAALIFGSLLRRDRDTRLAPLPGRSNL